MNALVIFGLVACCLICLLVIVWLARELAHLRRSEAARGAAEIDAKASRVESPAQAKEEETTARTEAGRTTTTAGVERTSEAGRTPEAVSSGIAATEISPKLTTETTAASVAFESGENGSPEAADSLRGADGLRGIESAEETKERASVADAGLPDATPEQAGWAGETDAPPPSSTASDSSSSDNSTSGSTALDAEVAREEVHRLAEGMSEFFSMSTHPTDFLRHENFTRGVELLSHPQHTLPTLIGYYLQDYGGTYTVRACMALEAISRRTDAGGLVEGLLSHLNVAYYYTRYYALRALDVCSSEPLVVEVLLRPDSSWVDTNPASFLREFIVWRTMRGEQITFGGRLSTLTEAELTTLGIMLEELKDVLPEGLQREYEDWQKERVDLAFLKSFGRVWEAGAHSDEGVVMLEAVAESVVQLETAIRKEPPRSVVLVGERGTGKTTLLRVLAKRLQQERWTIFEANASEVLAGQQYIGQLEGRVQQLVREIGGKRVLWVVPNFHELLWAGRHSWNPTGILEALLPQIENGQVKIVGETTTVAFEKMLQLKPQVRTTFETCLVNPTSDAETLELARRWSQHVTGAEGEQPRISEETLQEAFQLARQYLGDMAAPGNLLQFLDSTHRRLSIEQATTRGQLSLDDLLVTLSQMTGLPVSILDDREGLDLRELQQFFEQRVLGQPEAIECLVERVAMIKAGLTDPTRPQGVFLFVGPTGTGKTEIAKTLAEFLFGSPDRMIRLDMTEFQTWESIDRILGETNERGESQGQALVNAIRKQPFSVVLLDEFEKAHAGVWDLFLQVFDDGRLTDRRGNTADFRHSVIIMTSNLGATLPHGAGIGFSQEQAGFAASSVERAVARSFRREFINRIDRVVVFRPLGRAVMRDLLRKELHDVLRRRGLRTRSWAVEWDESAIEFLLQKGFTPDLGARPLKRAVERYLLAPLARTIVNHQFPEGDQFLFVRSHDAQRLDVVFVDPDAPDEQVFEQTSAPRAEEEAPASHTSLAEMEELRLETIVLDARGTPAEVEFLEEKFRQIEEQTLVPDWRERKERAFAQTAAPEFWSSSERFSVLGAAEYMDRIEAGLDTAGSLLNRLTSARDRRKHYPRDLVGRLAEQLYLLDAACTGLAADLPRDAFILVRACRETNADASVSDSFAARVARMYRQWAQKRRMSFEVLEEKGGAGQAQDPYRMMLAVSGFGAYSILQNESGWHVLEMPQDEKSFNRARVQVKVVAQPEEPPDGHRADGLRRQAAQAFSANGQEPASAASAQMVAVVRRYREEPSPLVRDSVRGWRTGHLERVLEGDFDLMF